jgi:hypothetical protein
MWLTSAQTSTVRSPRPLPAWRTHRLVCCSPVATRWPTGVHRGVPAVVVDAVDAVRRSHPWPRGAWSRSHVGDEGPEVVPPALAHGDSSPTVVGVSRMGSSFASQPCPCTRRRADARSAATPVDCSLRSPVGTFLTRLWRSFGNSTASDCWRIARSRAAFQAGSSGVVEHHRHVDAAGPLRPSMASRSGIRCCRGVSTKAGCAAGTDSTAGALAACTAIRRRTAAGCDAPTVIGGRSRRLGVRRPPTRPLSGATRHELRGTARPGPVRVVSTPATPWPPLPRLGVDRNGHPYFSWSEAT